MKTAMNSATNTGVIALDADGVLLDFSLAYGRAWERAFGAHPIERDPLAYWPYDRWQVERLSGEPLAQFRRHFDEEFWSGIPAIAGAVEACRLLVEQGHELVCVSAVEARFADARRRNLQSLGFPIEELIATGNEPGAQSPKAAALNRLRPLAFVDDYLPYHRGVAADIHKALILRGPNGTPNVGDELADTHSQHDDLLAFARAWPELRGR